MKPLPYSRHEIDDKDIEAVIDVLKSEFLTQGPEIYNFEKLFADYVGARYAVAVSNGTAALHLSALVLGVGEGKKVITTPITFASTANCVKFCGGEVVFCDINEETLLMDLEQLRELLSRHRKGTFAGVIPVDFAGYPVDMKNLRNIADENSLWILEDACHAPGGYFTDAEGVRYRCGDGLLSDLAVFSFHPAKHITTGEGGMITTNRKDLYDNLLLLRTHGITKNPLSLSVNHGGWYYEMHQLGYNYRFPDILARLGISQLKKAEIKLKKRRLIAEIYDNAFSGNDRIKIIKAPDNYHHAYHLYIIQVSKRLELYNYLREKNIYSQIHYIPIHLMPYYKSLGWKEGDMPNAEKYYKECLSLPMYPTLSNDDQQHVINSVLEFLNT